jgi:hypothetical protein
MLLAFIVFPCGLFAQGGEIKPPICCPEELPPPPPPPPGGDSLLPGEQTDGILQVTISDAELQLLGLTRSQFLDRLAATAFDLDGGQSYSLIIPMFTLIMTADGSTAVQVTYFTIEAGKVAPEVLDTLSLVFITDGKSTIAILFTQNSV